MHLRKARNIALADAFHSRPAVDARRDIEIITWSQLRLHAKPCILINTAGLLGRTAGVSRFDCRGGFRKPENRPLLLVARMPRKPGAWLLKRDQMSERTSGTEGSGHRISGHTDEAKVPEKTAAAIGTQLFAGQSGETTPEVSVLIASWEFLCAGSLLPGNETTQAYRSSISSALQRWAARRLTMVISRFPVTFITRSP
jgi:hypothetical protein